MEEKDIHSLGEKGVHEPDVNMASCDSAMLKQVQHDVASSVSLGRNDKKMGSLDCARDDRLLRMQGDVAEGLPQAFSPRNDDDIQHALNAMELEQKMSDNGAKNSTESLKQNDLKSLAAIYDNDLKTITELFSKGKISKSDAIELKNRVDQKKAEEKAKIISKYEFQSSQMLDNHNNKVVSAFLAQKQGFLDSPERAQVIDYLKTATGALNAAELEKVAGFIEGIEKSAIERYKNQSDNEKSLQNQNSQAKSKLVSLADSAPSNVQGQRKVFTRSEIKGMSNSEFRKHEKEIMDQAKRGEIR